MHRPRRHGPAPPRSRLQLRQVDDLDVDRGPDRRRRGVLWPHRHRQQQQQQQQVLLEGRAAGRPAAPDRPPSPPPPLPPVAPSAVAAAPVHAGRRGTAALAARRAAAAVVPALFPGATYNWRRGSVHMRRTSTVPAALAAAAALMGAAVAAAAAIAAAELPAASAVHQTLQRACLRSWWRTSATTIPADVPLQQGNFGLERVEILPRPWQVRAGGRCVVQRPVWVTADECRAFLVNRSDAAVAEWSTSGANSAACGGDASAAAANGRGEGAASIANYSLTFSARGNWCSRARWRCASSRSIRGSRAARRDGGCSTRARAARICLTPGRTSTRQRVPARRKQRLCALRCRHLNGRSTPRRGGREAFHLEPSSSAAAEEPQTQIAATPSATDSERVRLRSPRGRWPVFSTWKKPVCEGSMPVGPRRHDNVEGRDGVHARGRGDDVLGDLGANLEELTAW